MNLGRASAMVSGGQMHSRPGNEKLCRCLQSCKTLNDYDTAEDMAKIIIHPENAAADTDR